MPPRRRPPAEPVYTTGDIARILQVAPRTASRWIDKGLLKGWRIPNSLDRRVAHRDLMEFMDEHRIPLHLLDGEGSESAK